MPFVAFHEFQETNGSLEKRPLPAGRRLDECYSDHRNGRLWPARIAPGRVAGDHGQLINAIMYGTILVTLDGTSTDRAIIDHIKQLAILAHSRVVLLHVADGWAARTYGPDAVSPEISEDTEYLKNVLAEFQAARIPAQAELAFGEPDKEIVKWVEQKGCDLVAMSTHGHRFLADMFLGTTATRVQHSISVPVLLLRAK